MFPDSAFCIVYAGRDVGNKERSLAKKYNQSPVQKVWQGFLFEFCLSVVYSSLPHFFPSTQGFS